MAEEKAWALIEELFYPKIDEEDTILPSEINFVKTVYLNKGKAEQALKENKKHVHEKTDDNAIIMNYHLEEAPVIK